MLESARYTKHIVWVCGGRDTEEVIIDNEKHEVVYRPSDEIKRLAVRSDVQFDVGLEGSILLLTEGRGVCSSSGSEGIFINPTDVERFVEDR